MNLIPHKSESNLFKKLHKNVHKFTIVFGHRKISLKEIVRVFRIFLKITKLKEV